MANSDSETTTPEQCTQLESRKKLAGGARVWPMGDVARILASIPYFMVMGVVKANIWNWYDRSVIDSG